jgi:UDP-glucose 4-epimerase
MQTAKPQILVTGGTGFIGSHTVVQLVQAGYEPILIDNYANSERQVIEGIAAIIGLEPKCYEIDCNDREALDIVFEENPNISGVIHFAAHKSVGESVLRPLKYYHNNLGSLIALLDVMTARGIRDIVFSSSCTVYGQPNVLPVTELTPIIKAASPYGNTKQISEEILTDLHTSLSPMRICILRYFNPIGAHPSAHIGELPIGVPYYLIPYVTQAAIGKRGPLNVFGNDYNTPDGTCIRDFIHVVDLADAHVAALRYLDSQPSTFYDVFNIGTGHGNTVLEVINTFEAVTGVKVPYNIAPRRPGDVEQIYADVTKAKEVLGWSSKCTLEESMLHAWQWELAIQKRAAIA